MTEPDAQAPLDLGTPSSTSPFVPALKGKKILIIDDEHRNIRALSEILETDGYSLANATSGERALEVYARFRPDLVMLDVVMSGLDGFETCRALKKAYGDACAPIIFITAKNESDDVVEHLTTGGVDHVPKPFRAQEALARVRTHLHSQMLADQQKSLVEQLRLANEAKNRLLAMAAHDLRNPLSSIRGLAEFLREGAVGKLTPQQIRLVDTIHGASESMLHLVNELLDVATIEAGKLKLNPTATNLAELIAKSVELTNLEAARKGTSVCFDPRDLAPMPMIDAGKMRQVIDNLLSNAVKYSPPSSTITVLLHADPVGRTCSFAVRDMGPGIPESERNRLFQDFSRLSVQPTGGEPSTGLGLAICRKIVAAHHGTIGAENLPGRGCEFSVRLPLHA